MKPLSLATSIWMFVVLLMGATVTNTGSQQGCGKTLPWNCRGFPFHMHRTAIIEFSHRSAVGLASILILALAIAVLLKYPRHRQLRILSVIMVLFLFLQAGLGEWAVMDPQQAAVLAFHFGVSMIALTSVVLVTSILWNESFGLAAYGVGRVANFALALTVYCYVVVYLGAFVRHTDADDACTGWPLCSGRVLAINTGPTAAAWSHRVAAGLLVLGTATLAAWAYQHRARRIDLWWISLAAIVLVAVQAVSGAIVAFTDTSLPSALLHAGGAALLFSCLCLFTFRAFNAQVVTEATETTGYRPVALETGVPAV
jgi:cytochrome c oxidase assembly protein subunit 15